VIERNGEAPLPGKWCALSPAEVSTRASHLFRVKGAVIETCTQESVSGYLLTRNNPREGLVTRIVTAPVRDPFKITLHDDAGGTRMHGNGEGRGLDTVVWVADQLVAWDPSKATVMLTRLSDDSFALQRFRVLVDDIEVARISNGGEVSLTVEPGPHAIKVKAVLALGGKAQINLAAGETTRLQCRLGLQSIKLQPVADP